MFVKVLFPFSNSTATPHNVSDIDLKKGEVIVVREDDRVRIGIVYFIEKRIPDFDKIKGVVIRKAGDIDLIDFWREFEELLIDNGLGLTESALNSYHLTNGNFGLDIEIVEKKLIRNLLLSHKTNRLFVTNDRMIVLQYGGLKMFYRNGVIHKILNRQRVPYGWKKCQTSYTYYSELLGIEGL